jgi:RNA polymerase sigma-70 factor (ECF subfamily)
MVADDAEQIGQALKQLPYDQCEVILLHLQSGLTFQAIAQGLDLSINTVRSRYRYGLEKLRNLLKGELENETCRSN